MTHSTQIISLHSSQGDYTSLLEDLGEGAIRFQNLLIFFWIFDKGFVFKYSYNLCTMCSAHDPNRYPPNGVWGNQRVLGGARKVLEEGGWSFPGLAQAPGSKHFNPLFYFLKKNTPLPNEDPSWMTPSTRQRTSPRRIWDAVGQNCTLTFSGLRGLFVNLILIDQGSIDFPYLPDFQ